MSPRHNKKCYDSTYRDTQKRRRYDRRRRCIVVKIVFSYLKSIHYLINCQITSIHFPVLLWLWRTVSTKQISKENLKKLWNQFKMEHETSAFLFVGNELDQSPCRAIYLPFNMLTPPTMPAFVLLHFLYNEKIRYNASEGWRRAFKSNKEQFGPNKGSSRGKK